MYCKRCGSKISDGVEKCPYCGEKTEADAQTIDQKREAAPRRTERMPKKRSHYVAISVAVAVVLAASVMLLLIRSFRKPVSLRPKDAISEKTSETIDASSALPETSAELTWQELYDSGEKSLSKNNYGDAIDSFAAAIREDPSQAAAYVGRGDAYMGLGETEENLAAALADYEKAVELEETCAEGYRGLVRIYRLEGDLEKAAELTREGYIRTGDESLAPVESVSAKVIPHNLSMKNSSGAVAIDIRYEQIEISGSPADEQINHALLEAYQQFERRAADDERYVSRYRPAGVVYRDTVTSAVTYNKCGICCVRTVSSYYMGGVEQIGGEGMAFDLMTGERLDIGELFPDLDRETLFALLKTTAINSFDTAQWKRRNMEKALQTGYTELADMPYFIASDGEIVLYFAAGTLADVKEGDFTVYTSIFLNPDTQPVYRLYNPNPGSGEHLYTSGLAEAVSLSGIGWSFEGVAWQAPLSGGNIYRLYNPETAEHAYSADEAEIEELKNGGWTVECIMCFNAAQTGMPVYRWIRTGNQKTYYLFTTSQEEISVLAANGWTDGGIAFYCVG